VQFADAAKSERVMASVHAYGFLHAAGIATSLTNKHKPTMVSALWNHA